MPRLLCAVGVGTPGPSAGRHGTLDTMRKDDEGALGRDGTHAEVCNPRHCAYVEEAF